MSILTDIQTKLVAPKNQFNSFGKYKYRSQEDILEGLKPLLAEHKASLIVGDELVLVGDRYYIKATAELFDESMKLIASNTAYAREELSKKGMDGSQITGTASSYARKYCLNGLFLIDDTKDADSMDNSQPAPIAKATQDQVNTINTLLSDTRTDMITFLGFYKVKSVSELSQPNAVDAINKLNKKAKG